MRKYTVLFLLLLNSSSFAQAPGATAPATPSPVPSLAGKFGTGVGSLNQVGTAPVMRYWLNDQTAMELMGGWNINSCKWGAAIGLKENVARPMKNLCLQVLERFTFIQYARSPYPQYPQWIYFTVGCGFEAFMPFCENLSVEGWVGAEMVRYWDHFGSWTGYQTVSNDLTPLNLGLHFDF